MNTSTTTRSNNSTQRRHRGQSGFTLIELLIVIAILGILGGVVIFAVGGTTDSARKSACSIDRASIETALEAFKGDKGGYPTGAQGLAILNTGSPQYLKKVTAGDWTYDPIAGTVARSGTAGARYASVDLADCS